MSDATDFDALAETARSMVAPGRGILAADESSGTIEKRFAAIGVESTEAARRDWRELLFRTDEAMRSYISGVILFDETIRQSSDDGTRLADIIRGAGVLVGVKVDRSVKPLALNGREPITEGLDGLGARLAEYRDLGAAFAKWRAVLKIGDGMPSGAAIRANMDSLARYAALCQEAGCVPIVEPEIVMDGDHDIERCFDATCATLRALYEALYLYGVRLEGTVLKPNMVLPGEDCGRKASVEEVAERTLSCLRLCVPASVPGIAFLSGGQSDEDATAHLNAMNAMNAMGSHPWRLTFSYGRALQAAPLRAWGGLSENRDAARAAFSHRARMNGLAVRGEWSAALDAGA